MRESITVRLFVVFAIVFALGTRWSAAATINVAAGGNLQAALDAAQPGDTIVLQAGATFTGNFRLPAKNGTAYITIRSSTSDSQLPAAGVRISPSYAPLLAKLRPSTAGGTAIRTSAGASYWRLLFLEFLPSEANGGANLIELGSGGSAQATLSSVPHHLTVDRCYFHGLPASGQRRGIALNSGDTQIINSHFSDIKGINQDTQAIAGWNGPGPYLIENNYIEAAAENILFGGSDPSIVNLVPGQAGNIIIRRNLITKPLAWRTQSWVVKNLLEFKNARNVIVEGNIIENNWASGQQGYAILFTPRNQSGTAPWTVVRDITIRNNIIRHVAGGFNILGYDNLATSQQTRNIVIENNLAYDINTSYGTSSNPAPARFAIIGVGSQDLVIDHNTVDNNGSSTIFFYRGSTDTSTIGGFELTNNLLRRNRYGVFGGNYGEGTQAFNVYTPGAVVVRNAIAGALASMYPPGNDFPSLTQWVADFVNASGGNYQLDSTSLSNNAATDGTDMGVNFTRLNAALAGTGSAPAPAPSPTPTPTTSTPYSGTPVALPGTVQAENYDRGGSNVAYRDTTSGNSGGVYRSDSVDLQNATDSGGGYKVKSAVAGEWLNYTVNVATAGTYTITARVSSSGSGGTFHIESGGVNKTGPLTVPNTGGWDTWQTVTRTGVSLSAGTQVLRLVLDTNGSAGLTGNFNWIAVAATSGSGGSTGSTPYTGTPVSLPGTVQAENYDRGGAGVAYHDTTSGNSGSVYRSDNVDLQTASDSGSGHKVKSAVAGEWLNYTVNVASAGTYTLTIRVASSGSGGRFHITSNGVDKTGALTVPNTGGWESWQTITRTGVALSAGTQVLRLVMDTNGSSGLTGNFNWIGATLGGTQAASSAYSGTAIALPGRVEAEHYDRGGQNVAYYDTSAGNSGGVLRNDDVDLQTASGGGYKVKTAVAGEWLRYAVNVVRSGVYALQVRVASGGIGGRFHLEVDGVNVTGPLSVPNTGGWQSWTTVARTGVTLTQGLRALRLVFESNGSTGLTGNFNWIQVQ